MATYFRLFDVGRQWFDSNGDPLAGGFIHTYEAGTTTNKATYQDDGGITNHENPIELDASGYMPADAWGTTGAYKIKRTNSLGGDAKTYDDIVGINDTAETAASEWIASGLTPTYASATTFTFAGDQTTIFHSGRRLKLTDNSGTIYATVSSSSYADPTTTVTVIVDSSGSITSPLTAVQYGLVAATNSSQPKSPIRLASTTTGATAVNFTAIPSWAKKLTMTLDGLSTNGTGVVRVVLGDSGGVETASYAGGCVRLAAAGTGQADYSNGFSFADDNAAGRSYYGKITFELHKASTFTWVCDGKLSAGSGASFLMAGRKSLSAALDRVQISAGGVDTFDAVDVSLLIE